MHLIYIHTYIHKYIPEIFFNLYEMLLNCSMYCLFLGNLVYVLLVRFQYDVYHYRIIIFVWYLVHMYPDRCFIIKIVYSH